MRALGIIALIFLAIVLPGFETVFAHLALVDGDRCWTSDILRLGASMTKEIEAVYERGMIRLLILITQER